MRSSSFPRAWSNFLPPSVDPDSKLDELPLFFLRMLPPSIRHPSAEATFLRLAPILTIFSLIARTQTVEEILKLVEQKKHETIKTVKQKTKNRSTGDAIVKIRNHTTCCDGVDGDNKCESEGAEQDKGNRQAELFVFDEA